MWTSLNFKYDDLNFEFLTGVYAQELRGSSEDGLMQRLTMRQEMFDCPSLTCVNCVCCWTLLWWWWGWFPSSLLGPRPLSLLESQLFGEQFSSSIRSFMNATTGFALFDIGCAHIIHHNIINYSPIQPFTLQSITRSQWRGCQADGGSAPRPGAARRYLNLGGLKSRGSRKWSGVPIRGLRKVP